jgi:hypothetical protein
MNDSTNKVLSRQAVRTTVRYHFSTLMAAALTEASLPELHIGEVLIAILQICLLRAPLRRMLSKLQLVHD